MLGTMTEPPTERADAARNRRKILDAAARLVAAEGAAGLSLDLVAKAADVGVGTVYRRFGDRAGLVFALLEDRERRFREKLDGPPRWARGPSRTTRPRVPARPRRPRRGTARTAAAGRGQLPRRPLRQPALRRPAHPPGRAARRGGSRSGRRLPRRRAARAVHPEPDLVPAVRAAFRHRADQGGAGRPGRRRAVQHDCLSPHGPPAARRPRCPLRGPALRPAPPVRCRSSLARPCAATVDGRVRPTRRHRGCSTIRH
ncbi:TetR/AcrR family transcriptional regulator [Streptomyces thermocarboxydus]